MNLLWLVASLCETIFHLISYLKIYHNLKERKSNPYNYANIFVSKVAFRAKTLYSEALIQKFLSNYEINKN